MKIRIQIIILFFLGFLIVYRMINLKSTMRNIKHSKTKIFQVIIMSSTRQAVFKTLNKTSPAVVSKLQKFLDNFVRYSKGTRINLNVVTNKEEIYIMRKTIEAVLRNSSQITYQFKTFETIQANYDSVISRSRHFTGNEDEFSKEGDVTFHLRFLYPNIFPYEKVITLDIDIEFRTSFIELQNQFEKMTRQQIIGIAYNQNPYYRRMFRKYRIKNPKTRIGDYPPGYPGLSAGVMLLDLQKIRKSTEFNYHLTENGFKSLYYKYNMTARIGDQDFYTLLGAEYPHLFYILDCSFNRLMSSSLFSYPLFYKYYKCDEEIKIYHGNGNSIIPSEDFDP